MQLPSPLFIAATPSSPEIDFRFEQHTLSIKGESYPENAAAFYGPLIASVRAYLEGCREAASPSTSRWPTSTARARRCCLPCSTP